ncbi:hypothetical protein OB955_07925 [Halobacteria archaeon AArc-m2/3/4]|uniref:DUF8156 domain-containing protein n=1 Tax=Natronoglomus mannanivorans TaxID=2979990 RepID=A0ABT2QCL5_9EURY|nr:hypothetical protein [Halobacteria archaeon AArc-m2/3/4]
MGRTNPTYRDALRRLEREWEPMRRGLRREYQGDFDRLFARARGFADAAGYANPPRPERALVLSVLLAHEVELRELRAELEKASDEGALERSGDGFEGRVADTETENDGDEE